MTVGGDSALTGQPLPVTKAHLIFFLNYPIGEDRMSFDDHHALFSCAWHKNGDRRSWNNFRLWWMLLKCRREREERVASNVYHPISGSYSSILNVQFDFR